MSLELRYVVFWESFKDIEVHLNEGIKDLRK